MSLANALTASNLSGKILDSFMAQTAEVNCQTRVGFMNLLIVKNQRNLIISSVCGFLKHKRVKTHFLIGIQQ